MLQETYERKISTYKEEIAVSEKAAERVAEFMILFQGVYFAAISFSELKRMQGMFHLSAGFMTIFLLPFGFFLLAMCFSMYVVLMTKGRPAPAEPPPNKEKRKERVEEWKEWRDRKYNALRWSYIFVALALVSLLISMGVYLTYLPGMS